MKAHQRIIREEEAARDPRAVLPLEGAYVEQVDRAWAEEIILRYEWLGTMNNGVAYYGLKAADGTPMGVACFGLPNGTNSTALCGDKWRDKVIALERGACVHYAHPHAASFLISRACKMIHQDKGYNIIIAYSDEQAGEIGTVYQACNWHYLGVTGRPKNGHRWKAKRRINGTDGWSGWLSSRSLRQTYNLRGDAWKFARIDVLNYVWAKDKDKAKYVTFVGDKKTRKAALKALRYPTLPYPKRGL